MRGVRAEKRAQAATPPRSGGKACSRWLPVAILLKLVLHPFISTHVFIFDFAMAAEPLVNLEAVFERAETPIELCTFIKSTLKLKTISDMVSYVERKDYEREWKDILMGAFPVVPASAAVAAVAATADAPARDAVPEVEAFTVVDQRFLISRMRTTYRVAMGVENDEEEDKKNAKRDAYEADMEKPLDPETQKHLKKAWKDNHGWEPVASMKGAPKFRNRVVRELLGACITNHIVENA